MEIKLKKDHHRRTRFIDEVKEEQKVKKKYDKKLNALEEKEKDLIDKIRKS